MASGATGSMLSGGSSSGGSGSMPSGGSGSVSNAGGMGGDQAGSFYPADVTVTRLGANEERIHIVASTLLLGISGPQFYASVRNEDDVWACDVSLTIELYDREEQSLTAAIGSLLVERLYRRADLEGGPIACLGPGELGMAGFRELPIDPQVSQFTEIGTVVYRFSYFRRDILPFELDPIDSLTIMGLEATVGTDGVRFHGVLKNPYSFAISEPLVTVFPVDDKGRPLGMARATGTDLAPSETWDFETDSVIDEGDHRVAYSSATF